MTIPTFKTLSVAIQLSAILLFVTSCTAAPVPVHFWDYSPRSFTGLVEDLQDQIVYRGNGENFEIDPSMSNREFDSSSFKAHSSSSSFSDISDDFAHSIRQLDLHHVPSATDDQSQIKDGYVKSISTEDLSKKADKPHPFDNTAQENIHATLPQNSNTGPAHISSKKESGEPSPQDQWHAFMNGLKEVTPGIAETAKKTISDQETTATSTEYASSSSSSLDKHNEMTTPKEAHGAVTDSAAKPSLPKQHAPNTALEIHPETDNHPALQTPPKAEYVIGTASSAEHFHAGLGGSQNAPKIHQTTNNHPVFQATLQAEHETKTAPTEQLLHPAAIALHNAPASQLTIGNHPVFEAPINPVHGIDAVPEAKEVSPNQSGSHSVPDIHKTFNPSKVHHVTETQSVNPDHRVEPAAAAPEAHSVATAQSSRPKNGEQPVHPNTPTASASQTRPIPATQSTPSNNALIIDDEEEGENCVLNTHGIRHCD